jgi:hypothetical protein
VLRFYSVLHRCGRVCRVGVALSFVVLLLPGSAVVAAPKEPLERAPDRDRPVPGSPRGAVEGAERLPTGIHLWGWAGDPNTTAPIKVTLLGDDVELSTVTADRSRADQHNGHGFDATVKADAGWNVCALGRNLGRGDDTLLGCRHVPVQLNPFGSFDTVNFLPDMVRVQGWAIDPDSTGPIEVHVYLNGRFAGKTVANIPRQDVGSSNPLYGNSHGFDLVVPDTDRNSNVACAYAINTGPGNANAELGCKRYFPDGDPQRSFKLIAFDPALYFPPDLPKHHPLAINGATKQIINGHEIESIELRGWIRGLEDDCNTSDPDWRFNLEVDPLWANRMGIGLRQVVRPGNLISASKNDPERKRIFSKPLVHVELNGWNPTKQNGPVPPQWIKNLGSDGCKPFYWAFDPLKPVATEEPLTDGAYVRVVGSLVTDDPHAIEEGLARVLHEEGFFANRACSLFGIGDACEREGVMTRLALQRFYAGRPPEDPANQARWTEVHPPTLVARTKEPARNCELEPATCEAVGMLAVSADNCLIGPCDSERLSVSLRPYGNRPTWAHSVAIVEEIGPTTNYRTIIEGNAQRTGAAIVHTDEYATITVSVQGQSGDGAPGRFEALYRASWSAARPDFRSSIASACSGLNDDINRLETELTPVQEDLNSGAATGGKPALTERIRAIQKQIGDKRGQFQRCQDANP